MTTPDLTPSGGWKTIESAPRDGTLILTWCVHANAEHCEDAVAEGYAGPVIAKWIDHNGGGFTWHGLAGTHTHWQPLPTPPDAITTDTQDVRGQPVSNPYKFAAEIEWLREAARYFSKRPTDGEDSAHWANVYNAANADKLADRLAALPLQENGNG